MAIQYSQLSAARMSYLTAGVVTVSVSAKPTMTRITPVTALTGQATHVTLEGYSFRKTINVIVSADNTKVFPTTASTHSLTAERYFDYFASKRGGPNATRTHLSAYFPGVSGHELSAYQILRNDLPYPEDDIDTFKSLSYTVEDDNHITFVLPPTEALGNINIIVVNDAGYTESNQIASGLTGMKIEYPVTPTFGLTACYRSTLYLQVTGVSGIYMTTSNVSGVTGSTYYYYFTGGSMYFVSSSATHISGNDHNPCAFLATISADTDCGGMLVDLTSSTAASGETYLIDLTGSDVGFSIVSAGCWTIPSGEIPESSGLDTYFFHFSAASNLGTVTTTFSGVTGYSYHWGITGHNGSTYIASTSGVYFSAGNNDRETYYAYASSVSALTVTESTYSAGSGETVWVALTSGPNTYLTAGKDFFSIELDGTSALPRTITPPTTAGDDPTDCNGITVSAQEDPSYTPVTTPTPQVWQGSPYVSPVYRYRELSHGGGTYEVILQPTGDGRWKVAFNGTNCDWSQRGGAPDIEITQTADPAGVPSAGSIFNPGQSINICRNGHCYSLIAPGSALSPPASAAPACPIVPFMEIHVNFVGGQHMDSYDIGVEFQGDTYNGDTGVFEAVDSSHQFLIDSTSSGPPAPCADRVYTATLAMCSWTDSLLTSSLSVYPASGFYLRAIGEGSVDYGGGLNDGNAQYEFTLSGNPLSGFTQTMYISAIYEDSAPEMYPLSGTSIYTF